MAEQSSWVPLPCYSPPGRLFPVKSFFVSLCVFLDNSLLRVRPEPLSRPWTGSPFLQQLEHLSLGWASVCYCECVQLKSIEGVESSGHSRVHKSLLTLPRWYECFLRCLLSHIIKTVSRPVRSDAGEPTLWPGTTVLGSICVYMSAQSCPILRPHGLQPSPRRGNGGRNPPWGAPGPSRGRRLLGPPLFFTDYLEDLNN